MIYFCTFLGIVVSIWYLLKATNNGYSFSYEVLDFEKTGQFGDYIGGVVGTLFSLAGTLLIYLTFTEQGTQNKKAAFESSFFELLQLHRDNLRELNYSKFETYKWHKAENRKVFKVFYEEFVECFSEVKNLLENKLIDEIIINKYKIELTACLNKSNRKIDIKGQLIIDIAYSIFYYGLSTEGIKILIHRFESKYVKATTFEIIETLKLKPKKESYIYKLWKIVDNDKTKVSTTSVLEYLKKVLIKDKDDDKLSLEVIEDIKLIIEKLENIDRKNSISKDEYKDLIGEYRYTKYYGGHQHRLGHYYRHLFQSFKFVYLFDEFSLNEKYFYAKTLRAQLSTFEQILLFINSVSTLGMKWEIVPDEDNTIKGLDGILITTFHLIKNIPGEDFEGIKYKSYYPDVEYESV